MDIGYGIILKVWGDYACFTRPELKSERVSYDVMTPSSARGILEAIYWKPEIVWIIDKIHVMNPIKFDNIRRNERPGKIPKDKIKKAMNGEEVMLSQDPDKEAVQRASIILRDICYYIEAHFESTNKAGREETVEKHYNIALRRMRKGQFFHQPYFGCREFPANFELIDGEVPKSQYHGLKEGTKDFGVMLWDLDFTNTDNIRAVFFRAKMIDGVIDINKCKQEGSFS